jgi:hypothetical protein
MNYLRHILSESKTKAGFGPELDARLEQENITKDELWSKMEEIDPSKNKGYVSWMVRSFQRGTKVEDLVSKGKVFLEKYILLKKRNKLKPEHSDIGRIRTLDDLEKILNDYDTSEQKKETNKGKYKILLDDENMKVISILDKDSACYFGQGTRWCTAARNDNKFVEYAGEEEFDELVIFIPKRKNRIGEKYQLSYVTGLLAPPDLKDEADNDIDPDVLNDTHPYILDYIFSTFIPKNKKYMAINIVPNPTEELQMETIKKGMSISLIRNPTEAVKLEAVKRNGFSIKYIQNPSNDVQVEAVNDEPSAIRFIENPTEKAQIVAVSKDYKVYKYIKNPSPKAMHIEWLATNRSSRSYY